MKLYADTIDRASYTSDADRLNALSALIEDIDRLASLIVAALESGDDIAALVDELEILASTPQSPGKRVGQAYPALIMSTRRHARLLAWYAMDQPRQRAASAISLVLLLVALATAQRLLLPTPAIWLPPSLIGDMAALGLLLPSQPLPLL